MSRDPGASRRAPDIAGNALRPASGRVGAFASEQSIEPGRPHARGRRPAATCSNAAPWTVLAGGMAISWRLEFLCTAATAGFCAAACGIAGPSAAPGRLFRGVGASTADRSRGSDATGPRSLTRCVSGKEGNRVDVIFLIRRCPVATSSDGLRSFGARA